MSRPFVRDRDGHDAHILDATLDRQLPVVVLEQGRLRRRRVDVEDSILGPRRYANSAGYDEVVLEPVAFQMPLRLLDDAWVGVDEQGFALRIRQLGRKPHGKPACVAT